MSKGRKMLAPIIIILLIGGYVLFQIFGLIKVSSLLNEFGSAIYLAVTVLIIFLVLIIITLLKRIKEIKDGDEDDLGKY
ncbi:hypothetical protein [Vallitalea okinawensis]|uniref:hypothetical protein n=1 Tax=Vallitalea okinawensis TaxID=2078660 RepID=UPI000CFC6392|nr:hypothetical protein [Vallitalea okinawensis]